MFADATVSCKFNKNRQQGRHATRASSSCWRKLAKINQQVTGAEIIWALVSSLAVSRIILLTSIV